jgi:hypothetical protein
MIQQIEDGMKKASGYKVVSLQERHLDDAVMLEAILHEGPHSVPDPRRRDFFWVDGNQNTRFYVNVHDRTRTVYLITVAHPMHAN